MKEEDVKKALISSIAELLEKTPFRFELKVVKEPKGVIIVQEVTQERMDYLMKLMENDINLMKQVKEIK